MTSLTLGARVPSPRLRRVAGLTAVLARKNFRIRYKRAVLGVFWAVLQPAFQALVLAYVFLRVFHVHSVPHYPIYVLSGILPWAFFSGSMTSATAQSNAPSACW